MIIKDVAALRKLCVPVQTKREGRQIVDQLLKVAKQTPNCGGLAAPQIGIFKRVFVAKISDIFVYFVNPEITWRSDDTKEEVEQCLSLPHTAIAVRRLDGIGIYSENLDSVEYYYGMKSRVCQHELDHLNGRLITDYA